MSADLETTIRTILADVFDLEPESIGADTSTDTVEAWDSLQHLTLVLALEEELGISFGDDETMQLVTFPLIVEIVGEHLGRSAAG